MNKKICKAILAITIICNSMLSEGIEHNHNFDNLQKVLGNLKINPEIAPKVDFSKLNNNAAQTTEEFRKFISSFINMQNALQFGGQFALSTALSTSGVYLTKLTYEIIKNTLLNPKPEILLPGTKYGRIDRIKRWWTKYKTPEMIFPQEIEERLLEAIEKTKNIRNNIKKGLTITFDNLLLCGLPGTGKTLFAKILADETDMDFVSVTAASLLQSGVAGVQYFNELMELARKSTYGLIIFVDEADALFVDRDSLKADSDHYKVLNHILALTGEGNKKFMLVAATNHAQVIDGAMARRFQDRIDMPLPDAITREKLVDLYVKQELLNTKECTKQFINEAQALLTDQMIAQIIEKTEGLSNAEIKDIIQAMRKKALATANAMITVKHIETAIKQGIDKHHAFENDKKNQKNNKPV